MSLRTLQRLRLNSSGNSSELGTSLERLVWRLMHYTNRGKANALVWQPVVYHRMLEEDHDGHVYEKWIGNEVEKFTLHISRRDQVWILNSYDPSHDIHFAGVRRHVYQKRVREPVWLAEERQVKIARPPFLMIGLNALALSAGFAQNVAPPCSEECKQRPGLDSELNLHRLSCFLYCRPCSEEGRS